MDLLANLRTSIEALPQGDHTKGLRSVLLHIEAAYRHLARADEGTDEGAYTDAIYRCNQAFEGGVKEAYRVLASADPSKLTPFEIEQHLEKKGVFRDRVLAMFTNYRKEWRNPSTHDYTLDFDEAEAFLAIINISGFTKVLIDQISRSIKNEEVQDVSSVKKHNVSTNISSWNLLSQAAYMAREFCVAEKTKEIPRDEFALELARFLSVNIENSMVEIEPQLESDRRYRPDLLLRADGKSVVIETKTSMNEALLDQGLWQLENYTAALRLNGGLLVMRSTKGESDYSFYGFELDHNSVAVAVMPTNDIYPSATLPAALPDPR